MLGYCEKLSYYSIILFAFMSSISIAGSSITLGLALLFAMGAYKQKAINGNLIDKMIVKIMLFFVLTTVLSALFAHASLTSLERALVYLFRFSPFVLVALIVKDTRQLWMILLAGAASIVVADGSAIYQFLIKGNVRATAFHSHPMILAGFLVMWIPIFIAMANQGRSLASRYSFETIVAGVCSLLSLGALLANGTRGAWIAVLLVMLLEIIFLLRRNKKAAMSCVIILVIAIGGVSQSETLQDRAKTVTDSSFQSNSERILMWQSAWTMFLDHPITGVGAQNYAQQYQNQYISPLAKERDQVHAHNNYFQIMAEQGLIGFGAFFLLFGMILRRGWQGIKSNNLWGYILFFSTMGLLLQGLTEFNFGNSAVIRLYWLLAGIAAAGLRLEKSKAR